MTRGEIMSMSAGPAMDRLVAKVLGECYDCRPDDEDFFASVEHVDEYSTKIAAAWKVWEKLPPGIDYNPLRLECDLDSDDWVVGYGMDELDGGAFLPGVDDPFGKPARGNSVPLAICRALLVVSSDKSLLAASVPE